ncbi:MAG: hypothetical protein COB02_17865 [Candidatus Cloacimonadota bacterium]|nr:MAG: hypothetical protein COB02_17865 [Candidatus Cloacimonadota bacterium]
MKKFIFPLIVVVLLMLIVLFIGAYPFLAYWKENMEDYHKFGALGPERQVLSFPDLLEKASDDIDVSSWKELFELVQSTKSFKSDSYKGFIPVLNKKWKKIELLSKKLRLFTFDGLDEWGKSHRALKQVFYKKRALRKFSRVLLRQIIYLKSKNKKTDHSNTLALVWKIPIIIDKIDLSLMGKIASFVEQEELLSLVHSLHLKKQLIEKEKLAINKELKYFLSQNLSLSLIEQIKTELTIFEYCVHEKERLHPFISMYYNILTGNPIKAYHKYIKRKELWKNDISHKEFLSLPLWTLKGLPAIPRTQHLIIRNRLKMSLLQCQFDYDYYNDLDLDYQMSIKIKESVRICYIEGKDYNNLGLKKFREFKILKN